MEMDLKYCFVLTLYILFAVNSRVEGLASTAINMLKENKSVSEKLMVFCQMNREIPICKIALGNSKVKKLRRKNTKRIRRELVVDPRMIRIKKDILRRRQEGGGAYIKF